LYRQLEYPFFGNEEFALQRCLSERHNMATVSLEVCLSESQIIARVNTHDRNCYTADGRWWDRNKLECCV